MQVTHGLAFRGENRTYLSLEIDARRVLSEGALAMSAKTAANTAILRGIRSKSVQMERHRLSSRCPIPRYRLADSIRLAGLSQLCPRYLDSFRSAVAFPAVGAIDEVRRAEFFRNGGCAVR